MTFIFIFHILLPSISFFRYLTRPYRLYVGKINGPQPYPIIGNLLTIIFTPLRQLHLKWREKYGKLVVSFIGREASFFTYDAELIKHILVKDFHMFRNRREPPVNHEVLMRNMFNS